MTTKSLPLALAIGLAIFLQAGCAIHYFDKSTGTEHLWGIGHMKMRITPRPEEESTQTNGSLALVTGVSTLGLNLGIGQDYSGFTAGWDSRSRVIIHEENATFCLAWPSTSIWLLNESPDFFRLRVGTNFPTEPNQKLH